MTRASISSYTINSKTYRVIETTPAGGDSGAEKLLMAQRLSKVSK